MPLPIDHLEEVEPATISVVVAQEGDGAGRSLLPPSPPHVVGEEIMMVDVMECDEVELADTLAELGIEAAMWTGLGDFPHPLSQHLRLEKCHVCRCHE